jgi:glycosyltransferase involved in cell wall biosynthesis
MHAIHRLLVVTDTWHPEVNGVVRTWDTTIELLSRQGIDVQVIHPNLFWSFRFPFYPDIRVAWPSTRQIQELIDRFDPDAIHIATEGTLGLSVRNYCTWRNLRFTTSYHTKTPEYLARLAWFPSGLSYAYLRWFHSRSQAIMVAAPSIEAELRGRGFKVPIVRWSRGVNLDLFYPRPKCEPARTGARLAFPVTQRPISMYVGRVSSEKNLEAFLELKMPGTKYVVGDGPARLPLQQQYRDAVFLGKLTGEVLAQAFANADVFVFPSRTDTFGLVIIEALASGVPVAGYPAPGPIDILTHDKVGAVDEDLGRAVTRALQHGDPAECVKLARQYTWEKCTQQFLSHLVPAKVSRGPGTGYRVIAASREETLTFPSR